MERWISLVGLLAMIGFAWLMSSNKNRISLRIVLGGLLLQIVFALVILKTVPGRYAFDVMGTFFNQVLTFVDEGSAFLFDIYPRESDPAPLPPTYTLWRSFAFGILPTIVFFRH